MPLADDAARIKEGIRGQPLERRDDREIQFESGRRIHLSGSMPAYQPPPEWDAFTAQNQMPAHLPNYDKLTPTERNLMDALPGTMENSLVRGASKFIEGVTDTKVGNALFTAFDSLAEGMERTMGTAYQVWQDPTEFEVRGLWGGDVEAASKWRAAWQASHNFYEAIAPPIQYSADEQSAKVRVDVANFFGFEPTKEDLESVAWLEEENKTANERWQKIFKGLEVDTGGLPALVAMREELLAGEDIEVVSDRFIEGLGALAIRSQVWDAVGHTFIDPINLILPRLHVTERLASLKAVSQTARLAPEVSTAVTGIKTALSPLDELAKVGKLADEAVDVSRLADDGVDLSRIADDVFQLAEDVTRNGDLPRIGVLDDIAVDLRKASESGEGLQEVVKRADDLLSKFDDLKEMNYLERAGFAIMGGDPFNPAGWQMKAKNLPFIGPIVSMGTLTPQSRASWMVNTMSSNIRNLLDRGKDPLDWFQQMRKAAAGAFDPKMGHMLLSPIGRHTQGVLKATISKVDELDEVWRATQLVRNRANSIAQLLGQEIGTLVTKLGDDSKHARTVLMQLEELARSGKVADPFLDAVQQGVIKVEDIIAIGKKLKATKGKMIPYTNDMMRAALVSGFAESAATMGVAQFGVKAEGFWTKAANATKSAEALVLLGMNPLYPIKNFFNNEVTMAARGLLGRMSPEDLVRVWDDFGIQTPRLREGVTIQGIGEGLEEIGDVERKAMQVIQEVRKGDPQGLAKLLDNTQEFFQGTPKLMRGAAASIEQMHSQRATTLGMIKAWDNVWRPGKGYSKFDQVVPGLADELTKFDDAMPDEIMKAIRNFKKPEDIQAFKLAENINLNLENVLNRTAQRLGMDPNDVKMVVNAEVHSQVERILKNLPTNASPALIEESFSAIQRTVREGLDDSFRRALPQMQEYYRAKAAVGGPNAAMGIYSEVSENFFARQVSHARRLDEEIPEIMQISDKAARNRKWAELLEESGRAYDNTWSFGETAFRGLAEGYEQLPKSVGREFGELRKISQDYIQLRNDKWSEFFKQIDSGVFRDEFAVRAAREDIYRALDDDYLKLIEDTQLRWQKIDDSFIKSVPNQTVRARVSAWREQMRTMRRMDMEDLLEFRRSIRGLDRAETSKAWSKFNQDRMRTQFTIAQMDNYGRRMLEGDPRAAEFFEQQANAARQQQAAQKLQDISNRQQMGAELDELRTFRAGISDEVAGQPEQADDIAAIEQRIQQLEQQMDTLPDPFWDITGRSQEELTQVFDRAANELFDVPLEQMPQTMQDALGFELSNMYMRLGVEGESGFRIFEGNKVIGGLKSAFPEWYKEISTKSIRTKNGKRLTGLAAVQEATKQLMAGDVPKENLSILKDLKRIAFENLSRRGSLPDDFVQVTSKVRQAVDAPDFAKALNAVDDGAQAFMPNPDSVIPQEMFRELGFDELWFDRGSSFVKGMQDETLAIASEPAKRFADMPAEAQAGLNKYFNVLEGELRDSRAVSMRLAEGMRDSALLNYQAQYGFDAFLGQFAPFQFWWTHSIARWAVHSLDRPQMLSTYLKMSHFMNNVVGEHKSLPSRLKGRIKLDLPFVPEEMGEVWVDPLKSIGLPFENFAQPFMALQQNIQTVDSRINRRMDEMLEAGDITQAEYTAVQEGTNQELYNEIKAAILDEDRNLVFDASDFANLSFSLHVPISRLWNRARGTPERISTLPPVSQAKKLMGLFGVDPGIYDNTWGNIRRAIGLEGFDQWGDYRIDRELSNMVGDGTLPVDVALQALATGEGEQYQEAWRRTNKQQGFANLLNMLGLSAQPYPEGEENLRQLHEQFIGAVEAKDAGNPTALRDFFDEHPEYEARLALWKEPEERMRTFLVDKVWGEYNEMLDLNKREVREFLGDEFQDLFLSTDTRNYEQISSEQLASWLKVMGGETIGGLGEDAYPIDLAPPQDARIVQMFYDTRNTRFSEVYELQDIYFSLEEGSQARRDFRNENQLLQQYWDWRRTFLARNPQVAPYLSDNFEPTYTSVEQRAEILGEEPAFSQTEVKDHLLQQGGVSMTNLVDDYMVTGYMNPQLRDMFELVADDLGLSLGEFLQRLEEESLDTVELP